MDYRREIDGLRALAVLPVILFHAGFEAFSGGFVGVDVFFVISGYLITTIILAELRQEEFSIANFYERRARRILPALYVVMLACIPLAWIWLFPSDIKGFSQSLIAVSVFASNIFFWRESGYFDTAAELKPLLHTWSLAVEEQFYVLYPPFLILSWKFSRRWLLILLIILGATSLAVAQWASLAKPAGAFYLLPTRGWELLIGASASLYLSKSDRIEFSRGVREVGGWLGLALILYSVLVYSKITPFPGLYALAPTIGALLIILFASQQTTVGRFVGNQIFVGIGLISYSAYLWHQPLFAFARHRSAGEPSNFIFSLLSVGALVLAYYTWRLVEVPFRNREFCSKKMTLMLSFVGVVIFLCIGHSGKMFDGWAATRFSENQLNTINSASSSPKRPSCHFSQDEESLSRIACRYFSSNVTVAVFGNSHATELAYSLANALKDKNMGIAHYTISGCKHNYNLKSEAETTCGKWHRRAFQEISQDKSIEYVVLSYRNEWYLDKEDYRKSLVNLSSDLLASGKKVFLVFQAPMPEYFINQYLASALPDLSGSIRGRALGDWRSLYYASSQLAAELPVGVRVVDPADLFCKQGYCYVSLNGVALFFDDNHMSVEGGKFVAERLIRLMFEQ